MVCSEWCGTFVLGSSCKRLHGKKGSLHEEDVDPSTFDDPVEKGSEQWQVQRIQKGYCNQENYRRQNLAIKLANQSNLKLAQVAMLYLITKSKNIVSLTTETEPSITSTYKIST